MPSIRELHNQLVQKERSAVEITQEALDRIQTLEPKLHSFLHLTPERALQQARGIDACKDRLKRMSVTRSWSATLVWSMPREACWAASSMPNVK